MLSLHFLVYLFYYTTLSYLWEIFKLSLQIIFSKTIRDFQDVNGQGDEQSHFKVPFAKKIWPGGFLEASSNMSCSIFLKFTVSYFVIALMEAQYVL